MLRTLPMSTGGQTCTWDWPPWASTCPSPTCRELSVLPWLLGSQAPPLAIQALICLWSRRSSWCTLGIPVSPMKEDVERARMTFPSLMTDDMSLVFSATRPCWPSSARRECSSVPSKTSKWCSKRVSSLFCLFHGNKREQKKIQSLSKNIRDVSLFLQWKLRFHYPQPAVYCNTVVVLVNVTYNYAAWYRLAQSMLFTANMKGLCL